MSAPKVAQATDLIVLDGISNQELWALSRRNFGHRRASKDLGRVSWAGEGEERQESAFNLGLKGWQR